MWVCSGRAIGRVLAYVLGHRGHGLVELGELRTDIGLCHLRAKPISSLRFSTRRPGERGEKSRDDSRVMGILGKQGQRQTTTSRFIPVSFPRRWEVIYQYLVEKREHLETRHS